MKMSRICPIRANLTYFGPKSGIFTLIKLAPFPLPNSRGISINAMFILEKESDEYVDKRRQQRQDLLPGPVTSADEAITS